MDQAWASNSPLPLGFKFRPTKKELMYYLMSKNIEDNPSVNQLIPTVDLSKCDPSELFDMLKVPWEDDMRHFFCKLKLLRGKGNMYDRKGKSGFWKSTCEEEEIIDGKRRILVFYKGYPGIRTDWVIHQYALNNSLLNQREPFVICCLAKKTQKIAKTNKGKNAKKDADTPKSPEPEPSGYIASAREISVTPVAKSWPHLPNLDEGEPSCYVNSNSETLPTATSVEHGHAEYGFFLQPHLPNLDEGEASCNVNSNSETPPTATPVVDDRSIYSKLCTQPVYSPEVSIEELLEPFYVPDENVPGRTMDDIFDKSSEMLHFPDYPGSWYTGTEGVDGPINVSGPLAHGDTLQ